MLELIIWPVFKEKLKARGWFRECLKTVVIRSQGYNLMNWKINSLPDIVVEGRKSHLRFLGNRDKSEGKIKDDFILEDYAVFVSLRKKHIIGLKRFSYNQYNRGLKKYKFIPRFSNMGASFYLCYTSLSFV